MYLIITPKRPIELSLDPSLINLPEGTRIVQLFTMQEWVNGTWIDIETDETVSLSPQNPASNLTFYEQ